METVDDLVAFRDFVCSIAESDFLNEREKWVLILRFGFGTRQHTLKQTGEILGLYRERIRQIQERAVRKIRHRAVMERIIARKEVSIYETEYSWL